MRGTPFMRETARAIADEYDVPVAVLFIRNQRGKACLAGWALMAALAQDGRYSLPRIGQFIGCHHTTVLYGLRRHLDKRTADLKEVREVQARIRREGRARRGLEARLAFQKGDAHAEVILDGGDPATEADLHQWDRLGAPQEAGA